MTAAQDTGDNLTRAEARDRATKLSGVSYTVALDLTGDETFTSDTTVRFQANLHGISTFIDLDAVGVREATLNGRAIPVESYDKDRSRIPLRGLSANNELRIVADCAYQHTGVGMHRFADPTDGKVYLHTQFEPYDAHRVFVCFDQPDIKARFTLTVTAPEDWTVVSNSPSTQEGTTWRFSPTEVMSTYLVAVVAGPYHVVRETHGQVDMGIYCRESLAAYLDASELFTLTRQGLDFFEEEFDYPYPFAKYDQLFVPEFNFGAMENPGCVTFNEYMVFRSRQTEASHEGRANTLLHEMAHMWFGDLVTMKWWDDLWLNESFATYMATHALAQATRFADSWVRFAAGVKAGAMAQDQMPTTHPISADIVDTDAVRLHFDGITYLKGASVLKQLVAWVGQEAFVEGLRRYFQRHEWRNAELADFLAVLEETSGRKLTPWSEEWLETSGVNTFRAEFTVGGEPPSNTVNRGGNYASFAILQEGQPGNDTLRSHRVAVGLYRLGDKGLVRDQRVELDVIGERTEVPELVDAGEPDLLLLNDDDLTYAKVRLDPRSISTLDDHLSAIVDPLARNLCWAATWDMVRDAELPTRRYVDLVLAHAPAETDESTLGRLLGQAATAVDVYGDPANRTAARAALAAAARVGLAGAEPGTDRQLIWARHFLSVADSPEDLAYARALLDGTEDVPGLAVDTDLRWQIVMTLASVGVDDEGALIDAELERDPTDIGERRAASAKASRPTPEAKATAWGRLTEEADLPLATLRALAGGFHVTGQDALLAPYVGLYFSNIHRFWEERSREEALSLVRGLFPGTLIGRDVLDATDHALADERLAGPLRRILLESKDSMERATRARAADVPV
jgi:aminopeptidase N